MFVTKHNENTYKQVTTMNDASIQWHVPQKLLLKLRTKISIQPTVIADVTTTLCPKNMRLFINLHNSLYL